MIMMSGISGMGGMMGGMRPDPQQMFNRVDKDGSGGLDKDELSVMTDEISERSGIEIDAQSLMEEYDGDGDGALNPEETHAAMESLKEELGPPPRPGGEGNPGPGVYGQDGGENGTSVDQLLAALSEADDESDATGLIQEWLATLQGQNEAYRPIDTQA
jgi:hypothetical protein